MASHTDGNVRIFAIESGKLDIALVAWDDIADTSKIRRSDMSDRRLSQRNIKMRLLSDMHHNHLLGRHRIPTQ